MEYSTTRLPRKGEVGYIEVEYIKDSVGSGCSEINKMAYATIILT